MRIRKRWPPPLSVSPPPTPDAISSTPQPPHRNFTGQDLRRPEPQLIKVTPINGYNDSDAKKTVSLDRRDSNQNQEPPTGASSVSSSFSNSPGDEEEKEERCRRSDGKKWRCWRRPLEGFSKCKYHLDQARLRKHRYTSNIGSRNINHCKPKKVQIISSYFEDDDDDDDGDDYRKKKMVGFVKARSISSILSRTLPFRPAAL